MTEYLLYKLRKYEYKLNLNPTNEIYQRKYDYYYEMNGGNPVGAVRRTVPAVVNMGTFGRSVAAKVVTSVAKGVARGTVPKAELVASVASAAARNAFPVAASSASSVSSVASTAATKKMFTVPTSVIENIFVPGARRILKTTTKEETLIFLKGSLRKILDKLEIKIIKETFNMEKKDFDSIIKKIKDGTFNISKDFTPEIRFNTITNFIASNLKTIGTFILSITYDKFISLIKSTPLDNDDNKIIDAIIDKVMKDNKELTKDERLTIYTIIEYAYILIKKINFHISKYYKNIEAIPIDNSNLIKIIVNPENNIYNAVIDELTKDSTKEINIEVIDKIIEDKINILLNL